MMNADVIEDEEWSLVMLKLLGDVRENGKQGL
jgi:hypothetical protein